MEQRIELTPEELIAQSEQMANLRTKYVNVFSGVSAILNDINGNWSENLAHNFSGKIATAQKSFEKIGDLLQVGSDAAKKHADGFQSLDETLSKFDMSSFMGHMANGAEGLTVGSSGELHRGASRSFAKMDVSSIMRTGMKTVGAWWDDITEGTVLDSDSESYKKNVKTVEKVIADIFEPVSDSKFWKRTNEISERVVAAAKEGNLPKAIQLGLVGAVETGINATTDLVLNKCVGGIAGVLKKFGADELMDKLGFDKANETIKENYGYDLEQVFKEFPKEFRNTVTDYSEQTMDIIDQVNEKAMKNVENCAKYIKNLFD